MNMLTETALNKVPFEIVEIQTIYLDNNSESHFRPVIDSFQIYRILLGNFFKYFLSSLLSAALDLSVFGLADWLLPKSSLHILGATVIARLVSSLFNYWYNRKLVFQDQGNVKSSLAKYYLLCIFVMLCSGGMVTLLSFLPVPNTIIKALVDTILYLFNYYIQRHFVFSYQANIEGL